MTTKRDRQPKFQKGQTIEWTSQSAGSWKIKTGKVLAILKPGESAHNALDALGYDSEVAKDFVNRTTTWRYLVDATPPGFQGKKRIYVPDFGRAENNGKVVGAAPDAEVVG